MHRFAKEARANQSRIGMSSTATVVAICDGMLFKAHVGNSRAYLVRKRQLYQLTRDHVVDKALRRSIGFNPRLSVDTSLYLAADGAAAAADAAALPSLPLLPGDRVLLCTDGLFSKRPNDSEQFVEAPTMLRLVKRFSPKKQQPP